MHWWLAASEHDLVHTVDRGIVVLTLPSLTEGCPRMAKPPQNTHLVISGNPDSDGTSYLIDQLAIKLHTDFYTLP
jgi:hypothetical protein